MIPVVKGGATEKMPLTSLPRIEVDGGHMLLGIEVRQLALKSISATHCISTIYLGHDQGIQAKKGILVGRKLARDQGITAKALITTMPLMRIRRSRERRFEGYPVRGHRRR